MADEITSQQPDSIPVTVVPLTGNPKQNIMNQTLGDILQNNPQAQQMITKSMGISDQNFQQMIGSAQQNNLMHMTIGDLFKNGVVQQAVQQYPAGGQVTQQSNTQMPIVMAGPMQVVGQEKIQLTPEQAGQLQNGTLNPQQLIQQSSPSSQKTSVIDKIRNWFK